MKRNVVHILPFPIMSWHLSMLIAGERKRPKIIPDFRPPHYIRLGMAPLYTGYEDIWHTLERLKKSLQIKNLSRYSDVRPTVLNKVLFYIFNRFWDSGEVWRGWRKGSSTPCDDFLLCLCRCLIFFFDLQIGFCGMPLGD